MNMNNEPTPGADLDFTTPEHGGVNPLLLLSKDELLEKRRELSARIISAGEGKDWKAELDFGIVQKALAKMAELEATTESDSNLMAGDERLADRLDRGTEPLH